MTEPQTPAYQVTLPVFEGPLALLLHLIEREELDITQISLAQVTNQYLEHLAQISERNPDNLADFLVVAAKLLLIKSRVLLPKPPSSIASEDEDDIGQDLIQQLIEYKKFKQAAGWLKDLNEQGVRSYIRLAGPPSLDRTVDLGDVTLDELLDAVRQALSVTPPATSVDDAVPPRVIRIADQIALIQRETAQGRVASFRGLLARATTRLEIVVTLLALLEMVKQQRVSMQQDQAFGDILIAATGTSLPEEEESTRIQDGQR